MRPPAEIIIAVREFIDTGLTAFQAMASCLDDDEWDLVFAAFEDAAQGRDIVEAPPHADG